MKRVFAAGIAISAVMLLSGCVTTPMGPTIAAMPAPGKSLETFDSEEAECEDFAYQHVQGAAQHANDIQARNTILGTAIGVGLGAAVGDTEGAIVGGAAGAAIGSSTAQPGYAQYSVQRRYDIAYAQCMQTKGNRIGGYGHRWNAGPPPPPPPPPRY